MASPLGGPAANLLVLLKVILLATLVVSAVAVGNVPGLKWSALEVWEGSASGDAWTRSLEYLDFRSYVLGALSDVGYFDLLLDDLPGALRTLNDVGMVTGIVVAVAANDVVRRVRRRRAGEDADQRSGISATEMSPFNFNPRR